MCVKISRVGLLIVETVSPGVVERETGVETLYDGETARFHTPKSLYKKHN